MNDLDPRIDRLLRSAAEAREDVPAAMPFGFDTRNPLWSGSRRIPKPNGVTSLPAVSRPVGGGDRHLYAGNGPRGQAEPGTVRRFPHE